MNVAKSSLMTFDFFSIFFVFLINKLKYKSDWKWTSVLKKKEIQIGCTTFLLMPIKWKHKKKIHFKIETIMKILAHLIHLNCCRINESKGLLFETYTQREYIDAFSGSYLRHCMITWNWCWFRRFTLELIKI